MLLENDYAIDSLAHHIEVKRFSYPTNFDLLFKCWVFTQKP